VGPQIGRLYLPENLAQVQSLVRDQVSQFWIGNGSNLLPLSSLAGATVVKLGKNLSAYRFDGARLWAQAGAMMPHLMKDACEHGLSGLEMTAGVPTTMGGGLVMNFGAYGMELEEVVHSVTVVTEAGEIIKLSNADCQFEYRNSIFQRKPWKIVECELDLSCDTPDQVQKRIEGHLGRRKIVTPPFPNAGSVFKNPPGLITGKINEELGLKGFRIGNAGIWEGHGNYLINHGGATPEECEGVLTHVEDQVFKRLGITLQREIRVLG
jgi:UDP-N-acetylmuramate dehydrogenase